jgi:HEAT repeat protein
MARRPPRELAALLGHADLRIRREAQFALVETGEAGVKLLAEAARAGNLPLARLHALWGLGQVGRRDPKALAFVLPLLKDGDAEVRAQAAKVLGDGRLPAAGEPLVPLLHDAEPRVRFFTALSLGKLGHRPALQPVLAMLRENADRDAYLRHAGVMALVGINDRAALRTAEGDPSPAVRLAVLLAWRRLGSPEVARFLNDPDPRLVLEAARAINDVPITDALPHLAALAAKTGLPEPLLYRVLNANFRLGKPEHAAAVAAVARRVGAAVGA